MPRAEASASTIFWARGRRPLQRRPRCAAAALLLLAERPALSVNGNVAALVAEEMVALADALQIPLEVNLFHRSEERVKKIADLLREKGAKEVLGENPDASVPGLEHARALATRGGIYDADVVLIPLEDGDRCEALTAMGKKVIAIDLNPLSRTARKATVSIVDNILRAVPQLAAQVRKLSELPRARSGKNACRSTTTKKCCVRRCRRYRITWRGSFERIRTNPSSPAPPSARSGPDPQPVVSVSRQDYCDFAPHPPA